MGGPGARPGPRVSKMATREALRKEYSESYITRHMNKCKAAEEEVRAAGGKVEVEPAARVYRRGWGPCSDCGKIMSKTDIARHKEEACKGGEASF